MTQRTLIALSVVVLALAAVVVLDRPGPAVDPATLRRVFPGLTPIAVSRLSIARAGEPELRLERDGEALVLVAPARLPTDENAVRELLAALESLASRGRGREVAEAGLDPPAFTVTVTWDQASVVLEVGRRQPALGRTFVRRGADVLAVDDYAARALDRHLDDLRLRQPFPDPASGDLTLGSIVVHGDCLRVGGAPCARADAGEVAALRERLARLRVTRFLPDAAPPDGVKIAVGPAVIVLGGGCPGAPEDRLIQGALGTGCISGEDADALAQVDRNPGLLLDRSLLGLAPGRARRVTVSGGVGLVRSGGGWRLTAPRAEPADADTVHAWLEELASYRAGDAENVPPLSAPPAGAVVLEVEDDAGHVVTTWLVPGEPLVARRPGDGLALLFHPELLAAVRRDPVRFADRRVVELDPYAVAAIAITEGGVEERAERGVTQDRWRLAAPLVLAADGDLVAELREQASELRATEVVAASATKEHDLDPPRRRLRFTLDEGEPVVVELGRVTADGGCFARRGGAPRVYLLAPPACKALGQHLASRQIFDVDSREVLAVTVGAERWQHQGPSWYDAHGRKVPGEDAVKLAALVRHLGAAPAVAGYGSGVGGVRVVLSTTRGELALRCAGGELVLEGRPVRYRASPELCHRWPALCLSRR